tara:strand:- start:752 stop:1591 length:840 start_codon:yes stop_codon:yes gene_type:complete
MSYNISSDKFSHPLLKPILQDLSNLFEETEIKFFVIGAMARDLVMEIHDEAGGRLTHDLDIAIAISDWEQFKKVEDHLISTGKFSKDPKQKQRFYYEEKYMLDIVPFGEIMKHPDKIFWPPEEEFAMTVLGFSEVHDSSMEVTIDESLTIQVASLAGIFILKLIAWRDRNLITNKDAEDIGFILTNYLNIHLERATEYYEEIYTDDFTELRGSAILLAKDLKEILPAASVARTELIGQLEAQLSMAEESRLLNQILETNKLFKFDDLLNSLNNIVLELK